MIALINRKFGTWRGLVRALLAQLELAAGRLDEFKLRRPQAVRRVVFVCLGNICRSAFAHQVAAGQGLRVASLGLSTSTGAASPDEALDGARRQGVALDAHRATDWKDFTIEAGDLFLVMEVRQAREVRRRLNGRADVQVSLLGLWCSPAMPHLHDPFSLSAEYFDSCFTRVRAAVRALACAVPGARHDSPENRHQQPRLRGGLTTPGA